MTHIPKQSAVEAHFRQESFHDVMAAQLKRSPWFLVSLAIHAVLILALYNMEWSKSELVDDLGIQAQFEDTPDELIEPEEELEKEEDIEPVDQIIEEPTIIEEDFEAESEEEFDDNPIDTPFDSANVNDVIGVGGGAGGGGLTGKIGGRRGKRGDDKTDKAVDAGLEWLARHQSPEGKWDSDGFMDFCSVPCDGPGDPLNDVGLTGLALLAFLGANNTTQAGHYKKNVRNGIRYLERMQDEDSGLFGAKSGQHYMYNHALAALAMTESYLLSGRSYVQKRPAQLGVNFILNARNPYKAWRYESPPNGKNDTSVTGWMVMVLESAREAGLEIDMGAFDGALAWFDEMTDPQTGRTGYITRGSYSAREEGMEADFPREKSEAMTAVALLARIFIGQKEDHPAVNSGIELLQALPPRWSPETGEADMYYWYYASYVMFQLGGRKWEHWNEKMKATILPNQHLEEGCLQGSWDPVGPWGEAGGRVYSTALMVLCLEVYYRYGKVIGSRGK
ncbi:MAG: terpene cyclase/mutase family protein [Planctomycetota bacterium]